VLYSQCGLDTVNIHIHIHKITTGRKVLVTVHIIDQYLYWNQWTLSYWTQSN
jgi:hypothetical protein